MDYAENYKCFSQDEVQNAHWNQQQVTIFTSVTWFQNTKNCHAIVSDCTTHDKYVFELRVWTDGPSSQIRTDLLLQVLKSSKKYMGLPSNRTIV